ncbi:hypothetical protein Tco_1073026, partial [Tanacetum coccineum]
ANRYEVAIRWQKRIYLLQLDQMSNWSPSRHAYLMGKANILLDLQKLQKNQIFCISIDILQNTNFFRAFSASANVSSIYIQQFWNTLTQEAKTSEFRFQLDKEWFTLNSDHLRDALEITSVDPANPFMSSPTGEIVMDFVNELGYPEAIHFVSYMHVNNLYQPWRAILSLINQCLTGKTSGNDKPRHHEEFVQGIQTFFTHRDCNKIPSKKPTPHVIPYCQFTNLIIYYLGSKYNIHRRPESPRHVTGDDFLLDNLKFVPKEKEGGKKKTAPKADKHVKPAPAKQSEPATAKQPKPKPVKEKSTKQEEAQHEPEPEPQGEGKEYDVERAIQMSLESFQAQDQAHVGSVAIREPIPVIEEASTRPSAQPEDDISANVVCDTPSPIDSKTGTGIDKMNSEGDTEILNIGEEQGEDAADKVNLEDKTAEIDEGQVGSDPGKTPESRPPSERVLME